MPSTLSKTELAFAIKKVISQYGGMKLTVRQIYYRLVAAQLITNSLSSYQRIVKVLGWARKEGMIGWDAIEDRANNSDAWFPAAAELLNAQAEHIQQAFTEVNEAVDEIDEALGAQ